MSTLPDGIIGKDVANTKRAGMAASMRRNDKYLRKSPSADGSSAHDMGGESRATGRIRPDLDRRGDNSREVLNCGFDLAQFKAATANLDLIVDAANEADLPVGTQADEIAGTKEELSRMAEGIGGQNASAVAWGMPT